MLFLILTAVVLLLSLFIIISDFDPRFISFHFYILQIIAF